MPVEPLSLLPDIVDRKPLSPFTEGFLRGRSELKRPPVIDPDAPRHAASADAELERSEDEAERLALQLKVRRWLRKLPPEERAVLRLRFGIGGPALGVIQTAQRLGYCRTTIWAIERRALARLAGTAPVDALEAGRCAA